MFLKAGALSLALLLASRLLGLARESAQAAAFGTSGLGDVAVLMLTLPDWLAGLLASGALAYVLLPHWARQPRAAQRATQRALALGLLALGGALGLAREPRVSGRPWAGALHALADGAGVALLLAVAYGATRHFWLLGMLRGGPAGSADVPTAGLARIFDPGWPQLLQIALVLGAAIWLLRHWHLRERLPARELVLLALL